MFVAAQVTPQRRRPLLKMLSFRQDKDFQDASQQSIWRETCGGLLSCASRFSGPPQGEGLGLGRRLLCLKSALIQDGLAGRTKLGSGMPACLLACCEACSCQSLPVSSHWSGPATRTTGVNTGSPRGPTEAHGSLRVSARVCLNLEKADEEGRLPGCLVHAGGKRGAYTAKGGQNTSHQAPCADPRPKESPGGGPRVVCDVRRRRFVALRPCWASRVKSALTPHTSL